MIKYFKFDREEIINNIKKTKKTNDGHYWYPKFLEMNEQQGDKDDDYYYSRDLFRYKMYFTDKDIDLYLSKKRKNINMDIKYRKALRFYETNKELKNFNVDDIVPPNSFSIGDLVDAYEFFILNSYI